MKYWIVKMVVSVGQWICDRGVDFAGDGYVDVRFEVTEESNKKFMEIFWGIIGAIIFLPLFWLFLVVLFACTPEM